MRQTERIRSVLSKWLPWVRRIGSIGLVYLLFGGLGGCVQNGLNNGVFYKYGGDLRYRIGAVGTQWRVIKITQNDIAYYNPVFKATINVNSTCRKDYEDVSLSTLTNHIFYELRERKIVRQSKRMLNHRAALYTEIVATLDGVSIRAAALVLKKNSCIYDFFYIARPHNFGRGLSDFYRMLNGFKVLS